MMRRSRWVLLHLWVRIREETQRAHPRGVLIDGSLSDDVVLQLAMEGKFETLPYEVKMRLIDDARKASALKRGGDGKHVPVFDTLTIDGGLEGRGDEDSERAAGGSQRQRRRGIRIAHDPWTRFTTERHFRQCAADPRIDSELGRRGRLLRFYLLHPDAARWSDEEVGTALGVTGRTIRNYRPRVRQFVRKYQGDIL